MSLTTSGVPSATDVAGVLPPAERLAKGPVAIIECFQEIPCNPCATACTKHAITVAPDINARPQVNFDRCNGCGACLFACPGLAIFIVDASGGKASFPGENTALVKLPFEMAPLPKAGQYACGLDRSGTERGWFKVQRVLSGGKKNMTRQIVLEVPGELAQEIRNIKAGEYRD